MPLPGIRRSARLQVCAARADSRTRRSSGKPQRCSVSLLALEFGTGIEPVTPASTCCALPSELPNRASALPLSYRGARLGRDSNPRLLAWWKCLFMPSVRAAPIRRRSAPAGRQEPQPLTHEHFWRFPKCNGLGMRRNLSRISLRRVDLQGRNGQTR